MKKEFAYSADNDLESTTYTVNDKVLKYTYETDHTPDKRDAKVGLPCGLEQVLAYDGLGRTKEVALGDNLVKDIYYQKFGDHATNRVSSVWHGVNGIRKENTRYTYDKAGNIETVTENGKLVARYSYDSLNRLVREDNARFGTFTYRYDAAGNILSKTEYAFTFKDELGEAISVKEYSYKQRGWKDQLLSFNGERFEYDVTGNPTTYRNRTLSWQGRRLLTYAKEDKSATYTYDFNGVRTSKTLKSGSKGAFAVNYIYDGNNLIAEQRGTKLITYFYGADGVAGFEYEENTYIYRKNVQGDITHIYKKLADGTLELVAKYVYDAWGNHDVLDAEGKIVDRTASVVANINPFRYRGYYYDVETGLYYLQTRYYDPEVGRFISSDSIEYLDPETLGGLNLYAYCGNNPIMAIDPTGHFGISVVLIAMLIGAIVGGVSAGIKASNDGLDAKGIALAVFGGAILGAAISGAFALGGGAVAGLTVLGHTISGVTLFATAIVGTAIAGASEYCLTTVAYGGTPTLENALMHGVKGAFEGLISFGFGAFAGLCGFFKYADKSLFKDAGYLFKIPIESVTRFVGFSLPSTIIREILDKIFDKNWGN